MEQLQRKGLKTDHAPGRESQQHTLQSGPVFRFDGPFPYFRKPQEIGYFRQDESRQFVPEKTKSIKYLVSQPEHVEFDLKQGLRSWIRRDESVKEYLDDMLRWILINKSKFTLHKDAAHQSAVPSSILTSLSTDFVCWRGLLTKILCTPYENREGWKIAVSKFHGTYYMCEYDTDERTANRQNETEQQTMFTFGGYKFEQYMTTDKPGMKPNVTLPVNNSEGFCSVVRSRLDKHSLVYGGEVDCCAGDNTDTYVELKTSREMGHPNQLRSFKRFKLIKWWCQSFLLGIPRIVCGFRDDDSIVRRLEKFDTQNIPKYCQDIDKPWQPNICFNFLNNFLDFVKGTVTKDDPRVSYVFTWRPREDVEWTEQRDTNYCFLPPWYTDTWSQPSHENSHSPCN